MLIPLFLLAFSCQGKKQVLNEDLPFWKRIIVQDIDSLKQTQYEVDHNTQIAESVENELISDPDWDQLLSPFLGIDQKANDSFLSSTDSSGDIAIENLTNLDSNAFVQSIRIIRNKGRINVIEVNTLKNTFLNKRVCLYSYQPQKAFGINVRGKYFWAEEKIISINAMFIKK